MSELIATQALTLDVGDAGGTGIATPVTLPSTKGRIESQGIYRGSFSATIAGATSAGSCVQNAPVTLTIQPTSTKIRLENQFVLREGDQVTGNLPGTTGGGNPCTIPVTLRVAAAGQTKVKGD